MPLSIWFHLFRELQCDKWECWETEEITPTQDHTQTHVHTHTLTHTLTCTHTLAHTHTHTHIHLYACTHTKAHAYTHKQRPCKSKHTHAQFKKYMHKVGGERRRTEDEVGDGGGRT